MWNGVRNLRFLEATSANLEVVIRVTPRPKAATVIVRKDRSVIKVGSV